MILLYPARTHVSCIQVGDLGEKKSMTRQEGSIKHDEGVWAYKEPHLKKGVRLRACGRSWGRQGGGVEHRQTPKGGGDSPGTVMVPGQVPSGLTRPDEFSHGGRSKAVARKGARTHE